MPLLCSQSNSNNQLLAQILQLLKICPLLLVEASVLPSRCLIHFPKYNLASRLLWPGGRVGISWEYFVCSCDAVSEILWPLHTTQHTHTHHTHHTHTHTPHTPHTHTPRTHTPRTHTTHHTHTPHTHTPHTHTTHTHTTHTHTPHTTHTHTHVYVRTPLSLSLSLPSLLRNV